MSVTDSSHVEDNLTLIDSEYDSQFFGFTPQSFSDGVYNALNDYLHDCIDSMSQYITQEFNDVLSTGELTESIKKVLPVYIKAFDKAFDIFETYLIKLFHVPNNVMLPEDTPQLTHYTSTEEDIVDKELADLEKKITDLQNVNGRLRQEMSDINIVQDEYNKVLKQMTQLEKACIDARVPDLKEAVIFTCDKARRINQILQYLKPEKRKSKTEVGTDKDLKQIKL